MTIKMKSGSKGAGQFYWKAEGQPFAAQRSQQFDVQHDNAQHVYQIMFRTDRPVQSVRIDPSRGEGKIQISEMQLSTSSGQLVKRWAF